MTCLTCNRELKGGLYGEADSAFCNTVCATWFARAVANVIVLDGNECRTIDNWLGKFIDVQQKRSGLSWHDWSKKNAGSRRG
jgi:hypothetical protein